MPYAPPYVFVSGTGITASELEATVTNLQDYANLSIVKADLLANGTSREDVLTGEYYGVTKDHQFTTGDLYMQFEEGQDFSAAWFSGQLKWSKDLTSSTRWEIIAGSGKQIFLEESATVIYHAWVEPAAFDSDLTVTNVGEDHALVLQIDGVNVNSTFGFIFTETGATVSANSGALFANICNRRDTPVDYIKTLAAGSHTLSLAVNCTGDKGHLRARNVSIEVFYV